MDQFRMLIVEDREENIKAALEYFNRVDQPVDIAETYSAGEELLRSKEYDFAIFDLELPKKEGDQPGKLGFGLADIANELYLPWAVITSGTDHHQCTAAFVTYFWKEDRTFREITETPKNVSESW